MKFILVAKIIVDKINILKLTCICLLFSSCNSQPGKVEFDVTETEHTQPKTVKAKPIIRQIPDNLLDSKYTTEKGHLVKRDLGISLKIATKKKAGQPQMTENRLKRHEIPKELNKRPIGIPQKKVAKVNIVPALGKVVFAGRPISKPYMLPAVRDEDNFGIRYISQGQSLPGTVGNAMMEDSKGRIWIGTDNGLAVLEGGAMKIYTTQEGLSSNLVYSLMESSTGAIWIGTTGGGLNVFESDSFTHYGTKEGLSSNNVSSIMETSSGAIWIGTTGGGLNIFESNNFSHYGTDEGLSSNRISSLLESSTGVIWIGTDVGVIAFESNVFTHYGLEEGLESSRVKSLLESSTGAIWIGTRCGVDVFESDTFLHYGTEEGLSSNSVRSLMESSSGAIWIGTTGGGLDVFESGSFLNYGLEEGLSSSRVKSLMESSTGAIWIGTDGGGVDVIESGSFLHYGTKEGLSSNRVRSLLETSTGTIWIGTAGGGVDVFDSDNFLHYTIEEGLSSNRVRSLLESSTGAIWIGTARGGVDVLESGSFIHYGTEEGLSCNRVYSLMESSSGAIWIGTAGGGLNVFESDRFIHYSTEEGLSSNNVLSLMESSAGAIWIGTDGGGVSVFDSGVFTHYGKAEGLSSNSVRSLLESSSGAIWIGTAGGGLDVFESGSFLHYGKEEGLSDNTVLQLAMDSLSNIWAGTSKGLTRFVAEEGGYELTNWNKNHGLKYMDFNGPGNPMLFSKTNKVSKKGTMWSGVGEVLTAFEPPLSDTLKPVLLLTGIDIGQKSINWSKASNEKECIHTLKDYNSDSLLSSDPHGFMPLSDCAPELNWPLNAGISWKETEYLFPYHLPIDLELPYDQNHITFHYSGMKLNEQFDVVYRFILEGLDTSWSPFTSDGKADYRNIPPGQYIFRVRARGRNFLWSDEASISFAVQPPWWLTWWAKTFWAGLILLSLVVIYRVRTRALKVQKRNLEFQVDEQTMKLKAQNGEISFKKDELEVLNKEKSKLIGLVAHDLRSPLNAVKGLLYISRIEPNEAKKERYMEMITSSTDRMTDMVNRILDVSALESKTLNLRMEKIDLVALIQKLMINFQISVDEKDQQLVLSNTCESALVNVDQNYFIQVLENVVSNAIKYSDFSTQINISLEQIDRNFKVTIEDQGQGISEEEQSMLFKEFSTLSSRATGDEKATGLGLSIVKKYVEAMNGKIWCESQLGVGSKFILQFELA